MPDPEVVPPQSIARCSKKDRFEDEKREIDHFANGCDQPLAVRYPIQVIAEAMSMFAKNK